MPYSMVGWFRRKVEYEQMVDQASHAESDLRYNGLFGGCLCRQYRGYPMADVMIFSPLYELCVGCIGRWNVIRFGMEVDA
jgi:hypothetical protein